jgi:prepilin-type N-terminal cleavage/methylation domain-containing protein
MMKRSQGFTIVELLIVIIVIGALAALTLNAFSQAQEKARIAKRETDMGLIYKAVITGRNNTGKTLGQITGSHWSVGQCTSATSNPDAIEPRNLPKTHSCWVRYYAVLDGLVAASGASLSGLRDGDSRGNPYMFDENEGEGAAPGCGKDHMRYFSGNGIATVDWKIIPNSSPGCI